MATQLKTDDVPQRKIRIDAYHDTLFGPKRSKKQRVVDTALRRLLDVFKTDRDQRRAAAAILFRANREGLMADPKILARYTREVMPPARTLRTAGVTPMRRGKTARDRNSGATARRLKNRRDRVRTKSDSSGGNQQKKKSGKKG